MKRLAIVEIVILIWGAFAIGIAHTMISNEELKLQKERQAGLKTHTIYHDCFCRDINER